MKTLLLLSAVLLAPAFSVTAAEPAVFLELPSLYVIGGHSDGKWLDTQKAGRAVKPGTPFRIFNLNGEGGKLTAKKAAPMEDVCLDVWMTEVEPETEKQGIAICASWNPMPRPVKASSNTLEVYVKAVSDILISQGIRRPTVKILQHLRTDLDGDGNEEVLLSATHYKTSEGLGDIPTSASAGNYSFVALRRVIDGKVSTQILDGEFYETSKEFNAPNMHEVSAILDLDGDGKMEVILSSEYYEGGATTVWQFGPKEAAKVLEIACGV
ncbi:MAG: hypothetical protein V4662_26865 [Verrucomicrobiota bacterium]